jgi:cell division protein ZapA
MMETLVIQLMGREYQVSAKPEEVESLQQAVAMVNDKLLQLSGKTTSGSESLAVMAALHIAHDAVVAQRQQATDLPGGKRRLATMTERIDQAMTANQQKLF